MAGLHLVLTSKWWKEIEDGRKRVDYRVMSPHWEKRLWEKRDQITNVTFQRGYSDMKMNYRVVGIDIGPCEYEGWPGDYYRVWFEG